MALSMGGVSNASRIALFPMFNPMTGEVGYYAFDPSKGFNDPVDGSYYNWTIEDVITGRVPTISRLIVTYRDLGPVQVIFTLLGMNDAGIPQQASTGTIMLGTPAMTQRLVTTLIGMQLTAQNLQLNCQRAAGAGAVSIVKVVLCGRIESQEFA